MLIQKAFLSNMGSIVSDDRSTQTKNIGGSRLRDVTEFIVSPKGTPERSAVETIDTPVVQNPDATLNSDGSIFARLISF